MLIGQTRKNNQRIFNKKSAFSLQSPGRFFSVRIERWVDPDLYLGSSSPLFFQESIGYHISSPDEYGLQQDTARSLCIRFSTSCTLHSWGFIGKEADLAVQSGNVVSELF
jgi:hypothetical protein